MRDMSGPRGLGVAGATLVVVAFLANLIHDIAVGRQHRFSHPVRDVLGLLVIVGLVFLLQALVWGVWKRRQARRQCGARSP
jgi:hypothetical protein